jgi:hypothetical protein
MEPLALVESVVLDPVAHQLSVIAAAGHAFRMELLRTVMETVVALLVARSVVLVLSNAVLEIIVRIWPMMQPTVGAAD